MIRKRKFLLLLMMQAVFFLPPARKPQVLESQTHRKTELLQKKRITVRRQEKQVKFLKVQYIQPFPMRLMKKGTPEYLMRNTDIYMVGDSMAGITEDDRQLYYIPSGDFTQGVSAAELDFESHDGMLKCYLGVYEDTLYMVTESSAGTQLHTLTADGNFQ